MISMVLMFFSVYDRCWGDLKGLDRNGNCLERVGLHLMLILLDVWLLWVILLVVWSLWPPSGAVKVILGLRLMRGKVVLGKEWNQWDGLAYFLIMEEEWFGRVAGVKLVISSFFFLGLLLGGCLNFELRWFFSMLFITLFHLRVPAIHSSFEVDRSIHFLFDIVFFFFSSGWWWWFFLVSIIFCSSDWFCWWWR